MILVVILVVIASGLTKVTWPGMTRDQKMGQSDYQDLHEIMSTLVYVECANANCRIFCVCTHQHLAIALNLEVIQEHMCIFQLTPLSKLFSIYI